MTGSWPLPILDPPAWPMPDAAAWHAAQGPRDPLGDPGRLHGQRAEQVRRAARAYGRWLGYLYAAAPEPGIGNGLDHLQGEALRGFVRALTATVAPKSAATYLLELQLAVEAMAPGRVFAALDAARRHLARTARPVQDKRGKLKPASELYRLGLELMDGAALRSTPLKATGAYRDGLMIALLAACPVRVGNFASIRIGRHLLLEGEGYWLVFAAEEVKNARPIDFPVPKALTTRIDTYLEVHRPVLLAKSSAAGPARDALWISGWGTPLGQRAVQERIGTRTRAHFGQRISPHRFRDAAATSIAIADPEHVGMVAAILGHASARMAEQYYNLASSLEAARRLQAIVLDSVAAKRSPP